jgi:hypothetical protein
MSIYKQLFHANPLINPETGRPITLDGPAYKKLVKKYGLPKITANINTVFLPENDIVDSKIILMADDIITLGNLYLSYKYRFSKLLNNKFILDQLKVKYYMPENLAVNSFKDFVNVCVPPKFDIGVKITWGTTPCETDRLSPNLRWDPRGKQFWLSKLELIEKFSKHIKINKTPVVRCPFYPNVYYSALLGHVTWCELTSYVISDDVTWNELTSYVISNDYRTPSKVFYEFVNNAYIALPNDHKLQIKTN